MKGSQGPHFVLIISILILLSGQSLLPMTGGSPPSDNAPFNGSSYTPFEGSILIDSEDDFNATNGVVSGSGTKANPYVIAGWSLNSSVIALTVRQTTSHLIIRNVSIAKCLQFGILIEGADNLEIRSCYLGANGGGIKLIGSCKNIILEGNTIENNIGSGLRIQGRFENLTIIRNYLFMNQFDGLYADNPHGKNIMISNNSFLMNFGFGIEIIGGSCLNLTGNRIVRNGNGGIHAAGVVGPGVCIRSNALERNDYYGMELQHIESVNIEDNILMGGIYNYNGIYLGSDTQGCIIKNNDVYSHLNGIFVGGGENNHISDNNINNSYDGILVEGAANSIVNNIVMNSGHASIYVSGDENEIKDNSVLDVYGSNPGIYVMGSWNQILNNSISHAVWGIEIAFSQNTIVEGNTIGEEVITMGLQDSNGITIKGNKFREERSGIGLVHCDNIKIYDNCFAKGSSGSIYNSMDIFFSLPEKSANENIIGGRFQYGNYWPDYNGEDIDGDGIGDTLLPFGPGDWGPLVMNPPPLDTIAPNITLASEGDPPETGKEHTFIFNVTDDRTLFDVDVKAEWVQSNTVGILEESRGSKELILNGTGVFSIKVLMADEAQWINFTFHLVDHAGNGRDRTFCIGVRDGIVPVISEYSYDDEARTGEDFSIVLHARDNIGIRRVFAIYKFDTDPECYYEANASSSPQWKDGYKIIIPVDPNSTEMEFKLFTTDRSNNTCFGGKVNISIKDTIFPTAEEMREGSPRTGETFELLFRLEDNIAVSDASLTVTFDGFHRRIYEATYPSNGIWAVPVIVGVSFRIVEYELSIGDQAGHRFTLEEKSDIMDATPPTIQLIDAGEPRTGEPFRLRFKIDENRELSHAEAEWTFDRGGSSDNLIEFSDLTIEIPEEAHRLNLTVTAYDISWNVGKFEANFSVIDSTPPKVLLMVYPAYTSLKTRIEVRSSDNWGVERTWVQYSFDKGAIQSGSGSCDVLVPENAMNMVVTAFSEDISGLVGYSTRELIVNDGTPPRIIDHSIKEIGGGKVRFTVTATDNRGLGDAYLLLDTEEPLLMSRTDDGTYRIDVEKGDLNGVAAYRFNVTDNAGISNITDEERLNIGEGKNPLMFAWIAVPVVAIICLFIILLAIRRRRTAYFEE